jgi:hypothetical protein
MLNVRDLPPTFPDCQRGQRNTAIGRGDETFRENGEMKRRILLNTRILLLGATGLMVTSGCSRTVEVEMRDGKISLSPPAIARMHRIKFRVRNAGAQRHHFVVVRTGFPASALPVEGAHVRKCTYPGEPHLIFYGKEGGWGVGCGPGRTFDAEDVAELEHEDERSGVGVSPGAVTRFEAVAQYDARFPSSTTFVVYCDEAGHYAQGEYAALVVE